MFLFITWTFSFIETPFSSEDGIKNMTNEFYKVEHAIRKYYQEDGPDPM